MKHTSVFALLCLVFAPVAGSAAELVIPDVVYPKLPATAASIEGFTPAGWRPEVKAQGDLNGDGLDDFALVLRQQDRRDILDNRGNIGPERFDTNPHLLAVALARRGGGYDLALENHSLITRPTEPNLEDVLEEGGVAIKRGALLVTLHSFSSAGGWDMGNVIYTLRLRDGRLTLVGYDSNQVARNTGEMTQTSINYLTRRISLTAGRIDNDRSTVRWKTLALAPLPTIDQIGDGMEFDPKVSGEER